MSKYTNIKKEETLKGLVHVDYFLKFGYEPNIDNIDFVITDKKTKDELFSDGVGSPCHFLWAEAKKGVQDIFDMLTQLILTCKKTYEKGEHLAPPFIGCFDTEKIAFVSFHEMLPIFTETDFNWNTAPSNHESADFQKAKTKVKKRVGAKIAVFHFGVDDKEIKEFTKTHFVSGAPNSIKSPITKDNFVQIFIKWVKDVESFIDVKKDEWAEYKKNGILDCDFYRADLMSEGGNTITEKLKIVLKNDNYKLQDKNTFGRLAFSDIGFIDGGAAYSRFWNRYERPPALEFRQYIIDRRDLLVPQNIREMKGSFFTPKIWADKSKEYLSKVFGKNWQEEYYIWDCAAGTGNLLAGLTNKYNIWASDIDQGNVETMQSLIDIDENLNLLSGHIFQFDFLNDDFDKLPEGLLGIINDKEKRKKLIIYINPPYAESSGGKDAKTGVSTSHKTHNKYIGALGKAAHELFSLFMARVYKEISHCNLALFSKVKFINGRNFIKFRDFFKAEFKSGFAVHADTFDNVDGKFPIAFTIWNLNEKPFTHCVEIDVIEEGVTKKFWDGNMPSINKWISGGKSQGNRIGTLYYTSNDFQQSKLVYISLTDSTSHLSRFIITNDTLIKSCIYFSVRLCIEPTWLNDRDQFYYPNDGYKTDSTFQNNCLVFAIFHGQNRITFSDGVNHWIPFTEQQVGAKNNFTSRFMNEFLKDKIFSKEAQAVLDAGRELWKYYHVKIQNNKTASVNASFYDIREYFQGRNENGKMKTKSDDETYNKLLGTLKESQKGLAKKIIPKVYKYGFLKE